jgi:hypothetical protein
MPLLATCPTNAAHPHFITAAHVAQDWKVDGAGNFVAVVDDCTEITSKPQRGNTWQCATCGADAIFKDVP